MPVQPSRQRFDEYRDQVRERNAKGKSASTHPHGGERSSKKLGDRERKFLELFRSFLALVRPQRRNVAIAMALLTVGIFMRLIPPLGTKLAIDSALTTPPKQLPAWFESFSDLFLNESAPTSRLGLLIVIA
ncbi:MAG: ABC transporter ATP-binding protein, partial [Planctomycetota bacterium]